MVDSVFVPPPVDALRPDDPNSMPPTRTPRLAVTGIDPMPPRDFRDIKLPPSARDPYYVHDVAAPNESRREQPPQPKPIGVDRQGKPVYRVESTLVGGIETGASVGSPDPSYAPADFSSDGALGEVAVDAQADAPPLSEERFDRGRYERDVTVAGLDDHEVTPDEAETGTSMAAEPSVVVAGRQLPTAVVVRINVVSVELNHLIAELRGWNGDGHNDPQYRDEQRQHLITILQFAIDALKMDDQPKARVTFLQKCRDRLRTCSGFMLGSVAGGAGGVAGKDIAQAGIDQIGPLIEQLSRHL